MNSAREKAWKAINPDRLRRTLFELIDIYSPSGKEEDIQLYLEDALTEAGCTVKRRVVDEDRYNLVVTMGQEAPRLFLVGHVDTVPAWDLEHVGPLESEGVVRGLGSADMKGGCAAMVEAWRALSAALPAAERPPVGLLLVVGEEETGDGAAAFLEDCRPPWVVIGEPTGLAACFAHYGYLEANFVTRGRKIHSSLPELGHNAVESMLRVLLLLGRDPYFSRDESEIVYSIREMGSSREGFVVPDRCEAWIDLHLPPHKDPVSVQKKILSILSAAERAIPDLDLKADFRYQAGGYDLGTDTLVAGMLREICGTLGLPLLMDAFRSHSDGNLFFAAGTKPLILGPGSLETAHTPEEQVVFDEVLSAARIYAALCLGIQ